MKEKKSEQKSMEVFESMPVPRAVLKNALPAMAAMLMVLIYNLADTFFIGQTHDDLQVAAVSLATPVFLLFMAVGTAFGIGGTSVISRALGEGRLGYARRVCSFCMWGCAAVGAAMTVLLLLLLEPTLSLIGASPETWGFTKTYLGIVFCCGPLVLIGTCFANVIRAEGESGRAMLGQLLGNLVNVVLDPVMILGLGWDITGAAVATVLGNLVGAGYYILYFLRGRSSLSIRLADFTLGEGVCANVLLIGAPAALGSLLMSVSQIIINNRMAAYGDMAIAGMGVAMKVVIITGMLCMGLGQGVQPLLGYCVGARLWRRFGQVFRFAMCFAFGLGSVLTALCFWGRSWLVKAFLTDPAAFDYAVDFAGILLSTSFLFGVFYVLINALQAMGAAGASLIVNVSRQGLIFILGLFILESFLGLNGLLLAQPAADILSLGLAVILYARVFRRLSAGAAG